MNKGHNYYQSAIVFALVLTTILLGMTTPGSAKANGKIAFYVAPETEYVPVGELISYLLRSKMGLEVNKIVQYPEVGLRKVATGKGDLFLGLKLPPANETSGSYRIYQLCNLGPIYEDVAAGWGVPAYISKKWLGSSEDLRNEKTKNRLHREIIVYESDEKLLEASREIVMGVKGLQEYELVELSESVANSELERATRNEEWIVTTIRRPSLPFSLHDFRIIERLTEEQSVHLFGRNDLMAEFSGEVTQFLSRFYLPIELVNELIRTWDQDQEVSVRDFVNRHPKLVAYWVNGVKAL
ncbi:hypothetical protein KGY79_01970 [Candidatus Bipolaricaulota bacterium]|nr:hypothetical protein [Candidatus Bipolaricaulota bacterium]